MTIDSFFATQITGQAAASTGSKSAMLGGKVAGGVITQDGLAFFDLFLAQAEKTIDMKLNALQTPQTDNSQLTSSDGLWDEQTNMNILEALANSAYTREELSKIENPTAQDVLALNQLIEDELLLTVEPPGMPEGAASPSLQSAIITSEADFRPALNNLQRILQKLETLVEKDPAALIGTNITPEQITSLQQKVDDLLNGLKPDNDKTEAEEFAGIFAGLINILPPQAKPDATVRGAGSVTITPAKPAIDIPEGAEPSDELASKLNDLMVGGSEDTDANTDTDQTPQQPQITAAANNNNQQPASQPQAQTQAAQTAKWGVFQHLGSEGTDEAMNIEGSIKTDGTKGKENGIEIAAAKPQNQAGATPNLSTLKASLPFLYSSDFTSGLYSSASPVSGAEYGLSLSSFSAVTQGASSALLTHAPQAIFAHPGTQMVAASLQKAGTAGETRTVTLHLDPPELGRVEIKMSFEKNSKIKAVLTVEKPETHAMLQRDSGVLERALHDAGLDSSEGGLSFELAKEGHSFGREDGQNNGQHGNNGNSGSDADDEMIVQTTVNWAVDNETGHMRYNIMA